MNHLEIRKMKVGKQYTAIRNDGRVLNGYFSAAGMCGGIVFKHSIYNNERYHIVNIPVSCIHYVKVYINPKLPGVLNEYINQF